MKKGNIVAAAVCAVIAVYVIITCMGYPRAEAYGTGVPGPGLWPGVIACGLLLASAGLVIDTLRKSEKDFSELFMWGEGPKRVYLSMAILIVYVIVLSFVGFILPSVVMLFAFIQWFGKRKLWQSAAIAVAGTLAVYFVFKSLLNVPVDFGLFYI